MALTLTLTQGLTLTLINGPVSDSHSPSALLMCQWVRSHSFCPMESK
uniref:Uncharacterized protein n=1 Tax=Anguilla anguilla TaxID=7936 RepID=A0A0E9WDD2_ANGAN